MIWRREPASPYLILDEKNQTPKCPHYLEMLKSTKTKLLQNHNNKIISITNFKCITNIPFSHFELSENKVFQYFIVFFVEIGIRNLRDGNCQLKLD